MSTCIVRAELIKSLVDRRTARHGYWARRDRRPGVRTRHGLSPGRDRREEGAFGTLERVVAENGVEYAYSDVGEGDAPLVLLQPFRGKT
jgi:hypothetical protein